MKRFFPTVQRDASFKKMAMSQEGEIMASSPSATAENGSLLVNCCTSPEAAPATATAAAASITCLEKELQEQGPLRFMSWNANSFFLRIKNNLEELTSFIQRFDPDVIAIQFVLLKFEKARLKKQASHKGKVVKLSNRYYGPFKIIDEVNDVTFRLDLPPSWKIHNAFHVSLLRPYMGPPPSEPVTEELPEIEEMEEILEPEQIVHHQERHLKSGKITRKYLVKFKNYSALDAQWMTEQDLRAYPEILDEYLQALQ
ncbi:hypothetical protein L7F22_015703 [Adiantum nelumboides]|nr:hypothetical protein [Adiantum nelumboides]